jgi:hypothetical protein
VAKMSGGSARSVRSEERLLLAVPLAVTMRRSTRRPLRFSMSACWEYAKIAAVFFDLRASRASGSVFDSWVVSVRRIPSLGTHGRRGFAEARESADDGASVGVR